MEMLRKYRHRVMAEVERHLSNDQSMETCCQEINTHMAILEMLKTIHYIDKILEHTHEEKTYEKHS